MSDNLCYYIRIFLRGAEDSHVFGVSEDDTERFRRVVSSHEGNVHDFFVVRTREGQEVAVNLQHVRLANVLWEPAGRDDPMVAAGPPEEISLWFEGGGPPYTFATEDFVSLANLFYNLETGVEVTSLFQSVEDEDGEDVLINSLLLALVTAPSEWVEAGNEQIMG